MELLQLLRCAVGTHHRSRGLAWTDGDMYRSWCTGCNKPMIRDRRNWVIDPNPVSPPPGHRRAKV